MKTLLIIKPDAFERGIEIEVMDRVRHLAHVEELRLAKVSVGRFNTEGAEEFYAVHKDKPFYDTLVDFMSSGSIIAIMLEGDDAVVKGRKIVSSVRQDFYDESASLERNTIHGSDSEENAEVECSFFGF